MKNRYYFCYDGNLVKYLIENNVEYITKAIHPRTKRNFVLFEQTDILTKMISNYKNEI